MVLFPIFKEKVPIGKSTNMVLFSKEKEPYSTWYFFPLVLFPIHPQRRGLCRWVCGTSVSAAIH